MRHISLCECILEFLSRELILVIHDYDQCMSKVDLHLSKNKGFMFTIKDVWDQICSPKKSIS